MSTECSSKLPLVLMTLLTACILPVLKVSSQASSDNILNNATLNLASFDYFYISRDKIVGNWSYKVDSFENGNANIYYDSSYDDRSWNRVEAPFLFKATQSNSSMWVRVSFRVPEAVRERRLRLIFQGVWGIGKIWLNGIYLGEHYGYFSPFFFDVDDVVNRDEVNVLTLHLETPVLQYPYDSKREA